MLIRAITLLALTLLGTARAYPAQLASPYSNSVFPAQTFTSVGQGATIQLNSLTVPSTVGSSFASGTVTLTGTSLSSVTFSVYGSADNGATFFALPVGSLANPCGTPTTAVTASSNGLYQVSLTGMTHVRFVTSGAFTATSVSLALTATPNDTDTDISCGSSPPVTPTYTFSQYTFANNGSASTVTATTPAVTLAAGDFVFAMCQVGANVSLAASSSPNNSWQSLTQASGAPGAGQGFYVTAANAGSTTFTCTAGSSQPYLETVVLVYHHSGPTPAMLAGTDVSSASACGAGTSCTSAPYSTTGSSLVIFCGQVNAAPNWVPGLIGGTSAVLRGTASAGFTGANPVCEDAQSGGAQSNITSSISQSNGSLNWNIVGAAFQ